MKYTKQHSIECHVCDICNEEVESEGFFSKCLVCQKDACQKCSILINVNIYVTQIQLARNFTCCHGCDQKHYRTDLIDFNLRDTHIMQFSDILSSFKL
jgi:hypothetical protein